MSDSKRVEIVIIGGGIVGAACAYSLALAGYRPLLLERNDLGCGATAEGMGHLVVMDDSQAQVDLTLFSQRLWQDLSPKLPKGAQWQVPGTIWVATDDQEIYEAQTKQEAYARWGVESHLLTAGELRKKEPNLSKEVTGGLYVPNDGVVYAPVVAQWLSEEAQKLGAQIQLHTEVRELGEKEVFLKSGERIQASIVVNATGVWAKELSPTLPIRYKKGQLAITERYPRFVDHQLIELGYIKNAHATEADSVAFNLQPRSTGQLLIGSSRQYDVTTRSLDNTLLHQMFKRACKYVPKLRELQIIRMWAGFRAATEDNLPLLGPDPEHRWLYYATGHEGLGITTALASGYLLEKHISGCESEILADPYLPERLIKV